MIEFAGWQMPLQFTGILQEHHAVRNAAGLFDISHMGHVSVEGPDAAGFLNRILTNDIRKLNPGEGHYTLLLNPQGGILDDLLCYRLSADSFFLVPNASQTDADFQWLQSQCREGERIRLENTSALWGAVALQGPKSETVLRRLLGPDSPIPRRNHLLPLPLANGPVLVARTGYTGEDGFEWFCPATSIPLWWDALLAAGAPEGILPCGLGARDTLRLEAGLPLHGADLSTAHTPLEAGLGAFVALEKDDFIGKGALLSQKAEGIPARLVGLRLGDKTPPPRPHYAVFSKGQKLGETCSGCLSPSLGTGIALAYLPEALSEPGLSVEVEIRGRHYPATVARKRALPHAS